MPGLLQEINVASDTDEQLELVLRLPFIWNRKGASFYKTGAEKGFDWIEFLPFICGEPDVKPLPYPLDTPEKLFQFVKGWLSSAKRGDEYDTDGSRREGWQVTSGSVYYAVCRVKTEWIIYGK